MPFWAVNIRVSAWWRRCVGFCKFTKKQNKNLWNCFFFLKIFQNCPNISHFQSSTNSSKFWFKIHENICVSNIFHYYTKFSKFQNIHFFKTNEFFWTHAFQKICEISSVFSFLKILWIFLKFFLKTYKIVLTNSLSFVGEIVIVMILT